MRMLASAVMPATAQIMLLGFLSASVFPEGVDGPTHSRCKASRPKYPAPGACWSPFSLLPTRCHPLLICLMRYQRGRWPQGRIRLGRGGLLGRRW